MKEDGDLLKRFENSAAEDGARARQYVVAGDAELAAIWTVGAIKQARFAQVLGHPSRLDQFARDEARRERVVRRRNSK